MISLQPYALSMTFSLQSPFIIPPPLPPPPKRGGTRRHQITPVMTDSCTFSLCRPATAVPRRFFRGCFAQLWRGARGFGLPPFLEVGFRLFRPLFYPSRLSLYFCRTKVRRGGQRPGRASRCARGWQQGGVHGEKLVLLYLSRWMDLTRRFVSSRRWRVGLSATCRAPFPMLVSLRHRVAGACAEKKQEKEAGKIGAEPGRAS